MSFSVADAVDFQRSSVAANDINEVLEIVWG